MRNTLLIATLIGFVMMIIVGVLIYPEIKKDFDAEQAITEIDKVLTPDTPGVML